MNKYRNGKIYKLIDLTNDNIYIGSTIQTLDKRLSTHKTDSSRYNTASKEIILNGEYKIQLICNYPCNSKRALEKEEQRYIDMYDCVNKYKSYITEKQFIERYTIYQKQYKIVNKDKLKQIRNQQFTCECGKIYTYVHKIRHMKSKKHINYLLGYP